MARQGPDAKKSSWTPSLCFNSRFPGGPGLADHQNVSNLDFIGAKGDGGGGNNWSYKKCKAPVRLSLPTNQHPAFYRPDALPVTQQLSEHYSTQFNRLHKGQSVFS